VKREDRIRKKYVRGSIGVTSIVDKMRENILRWFGHVMRREETNVVRIVMKMDFETLRGKPKKKWLDIIENYMRAVGVCVGAVENRDERKLRQGWLTPK
jgi:hypothetical protein